MFAHKKSVQYTAAESLLYPAAQVYDWGSTLVVSPHQNCEVLGCGGAIALLRQIGFRVHVLFIGDRYEGGKNLKVNDSNDDSSICQRMESIGISKEAATFLDLRKNLIPLRGKPGFDEAIRLVQNEVEDFQPDTVLLPYLDQGSQDVKATGQVVGQAAGLSYYPIRMIEYRPWSWTAANASRKTATDASKTWRLDIKEVIDQKVRALDGHWQSEYQFPWRNPEQELLIHQAYPWEVFREYSSNEIR